MGVLELGEFFVVYFIHIIKWMCENVTSERDLAEGRFRLAITFIT